MERRIILTGKTENDISSTDHILLSSSVFQTDSSLTAVKQKFEFLNSYNDTNSIQYIVLDSPRLMGTDVPLGVRLLEMLQSVEICPEPHAFLLLFNSTNRMTRDNEYTIDLLRVAFGEEVFDHCIVVFTEGDRFISDEEFISFWKESSMMCKLVERCGGRITRLENSYPVPQENAIIALIETMSDAGKKTYQYPYIEKHKEVLQTHIKQYDGNGDLREELSVLVHGLGQALDVDVWKVMLVGETILALSAFGAGASGYGVFPAGANAVEIAISGSLKARLMNDIGLVSGAA